MKKLTTTEARKLELERDHSKRIAEINKNLGKISQKDFEAAVEGLAKCEAEFRGIAEKEFFRMYPDVVDALRAHDFEVLGHKNITENGAFVGLVAVEKTVNLDLRKWCEYHKYDLSWFYEMQALNKRLTMVVAETLGYTPEQVLAIDGSYAMHKMAEKIALGETPTSNTQVVKHLQKVFDLLAPGAGKVNNHDIAFIRSCYTKKGREALKVACAKHSALQGILLDVFHRVVTGGVYTVDYKVAKRAAVPTAPAEKPAAPAPEKPAKKSTGKKDKAAKVEAVAPAA